MRNIEVEELLSRNRLGGEPIPEDLRILLEHRDELLVRTGIELNWDQDWAPWRDTSYLTEEDWANPDIAANVRAIDSVSDLTAFIAAHEDGEYIGYWRGPEGRAISHSPLITLDNEGQFAFAGGGNFAAALLSRAFDEGFAELRAWLRSLGISEIPESPSDIEDPKNVSSPRDLHHEIYTKTLGTGT
jgi:hypothetical protein